MARLAEKEIAKEKFYATKNPINIWGVNPVQDGLFQGCYPHGYPTMMKLGTVIPYLLTSATFYRKSANFAISRNTCIDCILIRNF